MYCSKCGKQLADQSKFCSYCGTQIYGPSAENRNPPTNSREPVREAYVSQPVSASKKSSEFPKWLLSATIAVLVFFSVKIITENLLTRDPGKEDAGESGIHLFDHESNFEKGFKKGLMADPDISNAMDSCARGAIYENSYVRYGMTQLYMPDYSLLPGEGDGRDWLISADNGLLFTAYKQLEILDVSFEISDEAGMLESYKQTYSDAAMVDYQKYYVSGFPVIRYIVEYTSDGVYQYQGELIVMPEETADETIRLTIFADAAGYGAADIDQVFDTLQVSPEYKVTVEDTNVIGFNRITVK